MIRSEVELLDALEDGQEMAVTDSHGRPALVWANEEGQLGIFRLPFEEEPLRTELVTPRDFPMTRLIQPPQVTIYGTERQREALNWLTVRSAREHLIGVAMRPIVAPGYQRVLDIARDALERPHDEASSDQLDLECLEMAETMVVIAGEDGHARSLAGVFRAMLLHSARTPNHQIGDREPVVCDHEGGIFEGLDRCADCGAPVRENGDRDA